jgi:hypothetical protein
LVRRSLKSSPVTTTSFRGRMFFHRSGELSSKES